MNRTKDAIVAAFGALLSERPLNKITVKDIVERCGINRNTFYYHFAGIPSLVERTTEHIADQIIQTYSKSCSPMDCVVPLVQYCTKSKTAILHIYRSVQRETFLKYLDHIATYAVSHYVEAVIEKLSPVFMDVKKTQLLIKYYKCTLVGGMLDWLNAGMEYDLLSDMASICNLLKGFGEQALLQCVTPQNSENRPT